MDENRTMRVKVAMDRLAEAFQELTEAADRLHFALLDMCPPEKTRAPRSWEVEREDFMRRQGETLT